MPRRFKFLSVSHAQASCACLDATTMLHGACTAPILCQSLANSLRRHYAGSHASPLHHPSRDPGHRLSAPPTRHPHRRESLMRVITFATRPRSLFHRQSNVLKLQSPDRSDCTPGIPIVHATLAHSRAPRKHQMKLEIVYKRNA